MALSVFWRFVRPCLHLAVSTTAADPADWPFFWPKTRRCRGWPKTRRGRGWPSTRRVGLALAAALALHDGARVATFDAGLDEVVVPPCCRVFLLLPRAGLSASAPRLARR